MNKSIKIERVYLVSPTDIRVGNTTKPERVLACGRYNLQMIGANWLCVEVAGYRTWIPVSNIKSIVERKENDEK